MEPLFKKINVLILKKNEIAVLDIKLELQMGNFNQLEWF